MNDIKRVTMHSEVRGEGMPLLAIHGWGVDHRLMSGCLEPVFERASLPVRRHYVDLPGMGKTSGSDLISGSDDMVEILENYIDANFPDTPFLLVGESYGGYLSRELIRRRKRMVRGLFLICTAFRPFIMTDVGMDKGDVPEHRVVEEDEAFMATLSEKNRRSFEFMAVRKTRDAWERYERDVLPGIEAADQDFLTRRLSLNTEFRTDPDVIGSPFMGPTLIVAGRQDSTAGYRGIWSILENFPRATFAVLDGAGHNLQIEQVPLFESLAGEWLDRVGLEMASQ